MTEVDDLSTGWRGLPPTEGIRLQLGSTGWVLVRPSGTEKLIRVMAEGDDEALVKRVVNEVAEAVKAAG